MATSIKSNEDPAYIVQSDDLFPSVNNAGTIGKSVTAEQIVEGSDIRTLIDTKQRLLSDIASFELNQTGTGDRNTFIDLHSSDDASQADRSARIIRNLGVNGAFVLENKGTNIVQIKAGSGSVSLSTDGNLSASATAPTAAGHLTRKDFVETLAKQITAPATASSPGTEGNIAFDSSFFYVCIATNTWVRAALVTW